MTAAALVPQQPPLQRSSIMVDDDDRLAQHHTQQHVRYQARSPQSSILFQWMETCAAGLFSTCEGGNHLAGQWSASVRNEPLHTLDYAQLHDHFLESLLQEAANPTTAQNNYGTGPQSPMRRHGRGIPDDSDTSSVLTSNHHARKRKPSRSRNNHKMAAQLQQENIAPQSSSQQQQDTPPGTPTKSNKPFDPNEPLPLLPAHFLHEHVRMQKDKGRGEEPGSMVCVKGQDACLEKLRVKMQLLCNTAIQEKGASMKRRQARVSCHLDNFVETRSILEVRLGFLSMMYGILLRWDTNVTGKITLVVLRKMCHESFYPHQEAAPLSTGTSGSSAEDEDSNEPAGNSPMSLRKERSSPRLVEGKAIVDWPDGTEVSILEPPYLIPRPAVFKPTQLTVSMLQVSGLNRKSMWMVQFVLDFQVMSLNLVYDSSREFFIPRSTWQGITYELQSLDAALDVKLYQVRRAGQRKKCMGTMQVPLANLPIQKDPPTFLSFPCKEATLDITLHLESESLEWTQSELEARRKASSFFWPRSLNSPRPSNASSPQQQSKPPPMVVDNDAEEEEDDDAWGWILCYMC